MNREILFRGKRIDNEEWVEGYCVKIGPLGKEKTYIIPSYASAWYGATVDPFTVGQYTGLTDKNGVKIFEGDIVRDTWSEYNWVVIFEGGCFYGTDETGYYADDKLGELCDLNQNGSQGVTILGNIHDNPELLEKKEA